MARGKLQEGFDMGVKEAKLVVKQTLMMARSVHERYSDIDHLKRNQRRQHSSGPVGSI